MGVADFGFGPFRLGMLKAEMVVGGFATKTFVTATAGASLACINNKEQWFIGLVYLAHGKYALPLEYHFPRHWLW